MAKLNKLKPEKRAEEYEFVKTIIRWQLSPIDFIEDIWGLIPQPVLPEYAARVQVYIEDGNFNKIKKEFFAPFRKGVHITWQQWLILMAVVKAVNNLAPRRITVASGHGIGKTTTLAWILLWFLFCHKESQVPVTSPSQTQMYDVLWKEVKKQINRIRHKRVRQMFEWQTQYVRIKESPETWFARARTAKKENPEALAGLHADNMCMLIDEASGVAEEIFETAEGSLTNENVLVIMISNPTRITGYFYESHEGEDADKWQKLQFSSLDSPIVSYDYVQRIISKHGKDSDEYRIRVEGKFPKKEEDGDGWISLLKESDLKFIDKANFVGKKLMGIDPAGEGSNKTVWVIRDKFKAEKVAEEKNSNPIGIANKTVYLMQRYNIEPEDIFIDSFGEGAKAAIELAKMGFNINAVNVGDKPKDRDDKSLYLNKKALNYFRLKTWLRKGGELVRDKSWKQLLTIKYERTLSNLVKIMSKKEMQKKGWKSPDAAEALMLTFERDDEEMNKIIEVVTKSDLNRMVRVEKGISSDFDPYSPI